MPRKDAIMKMREILILRRDALRKALAGDLSTLKELRELRMSGTAVSTRWLERLKGRQKLERLILQDARHVAAHSARPWRERRCLQARMARAHVRVNESWQLSSSGDTLRLRVNPHEEPRGVHRMRSDSDGGLTCGRRQLYGDAHVDQDQRASRRILQEGPVVGVRLDEALPLRLPREAIPQLRGELRSSRPRTKGL